MLAAMLAAGCFAFTGCSDDDDDLQNNGGNTAAVVNPGQIFTNGMPSQVGDMTITKNANGQVIKIVETSGYNSTKTTTFDYSGSASRAVPAKYDVVMTVKWSDDDDTMTFYITLNEAGFAQYAYEIEDDDNAEEWWFSYNRAGQLEQLKRSEGDNEITTMTYNNGDITKVTVAGENGPESYTTIAYTNSTTVNPIDNKGAIMLFDDLFDIDMDEFGCAYYAGMLGKATTHLPLGSSSMEAIVGAPSYTEDYTYKWTINENGFPASLVISYGQYNENPIFFNWF